jgi:hypothetical protein
MLAIWPTHQRETRAIRRQAGGAVLLQRALQHGDRHDSLEMGQSARLCSVSAGRTGPVCSTSTKPPSVGQIIDRALERLLEGALEVLSVVQPAKLVRHDLRAVMALTIRDFRFDKK